MFTEYLIRHKIENSTNELETSLRMSGQIIESLPLSLGGTTISREILPDGNKGDINISTQESRGLSFVTYQRYKLTNEQIMTVPDIFHEKPRKIKPCHRIQLLAKVAFGRPDHWETEFDFYEDREKEE